MSESYWRFVEPIWDTVSIYDGGDVFLESSIKPLISRKLCLLRTGLNLR